MDSIFVYVKPFDKIYQLAVDMSGAGYTFTSVHEVNVMHKLSND